ncbi:MAG: J domain-containing protein [Pseudomonadota bacterium]
MSGHWAFRHLGLDRDADERAIKRAYATRLKITRPDEDPEGFQALNEAYRAALDWAQSRQDSEPTGFVRITSMSTTIAIETPDADRDTGARDNRRDDDVAADGRRDAGGHADEGLASPDDVDAGAAVDADDRGADTDADDSEEVRSFASLEPEAPDAIADFDPDAFYDACVSITARGREGELARWLNAQPMLWSLEHKTQIAHWLLQQLHMRRPPIERRRFDLLANFFGLDDLHAGVDAFWVHRIRHRLHLAWEVQTQQLRTLAERTGLNGGSVASNLRQAGRVLHQLSLPLRWSQALRAALVPGYPSAVRGFLYRLDFGDLGDLPPPIREDQIAFWDAAGDRSRLSRPRWAVGAARCVAYSALAILGMLLVKAMTPGIEIDPSVAIKTSLTLFGLMTFAWLAAVGGQFCLAWLAAPPSEDVPLPWLRTAFVPLLVGLSFALYRFAGFEFGAIAMAGAALFVATLRCRDLIGAWFAGRFTLRVWHLWLVLPLIVLIAWFARQHAALVIVATLSGALLLWAVELGLRRRSN